MKFKIGFSSDTQNQSEEIVLPSVTEGETVNAVKSVVNVLFEDGRTFPYYNDTFDLKKGDVVYVDGKLAGKRGTVTDVTTKFKVDLEYYKRVLSKLDFDFHGEFFKMDHLMVSFSENALPFGQAKGWFFQPKEKDGNFFTGDGYTFEFDAEKYDFSAETLHRAIDSLNRGELKYLSVVDGVGRAIIGKNNMHVVEFSYEQNSGVVSDIYCDCLEFGFCHHSVAVCVALNKLLKNEQFDEKASFYAIDLNVFYETAIDNVKKITI